MDLNQSRSRICALPDDLLVEILLFLSTKDAIATTILSKRWRRVWMMLPDLEFGEESEDEEEDEESSETIGWFTDKSLELRKGPKLETLIVKLGPRCPVDVDVRNWANKAVDMFVESLYFKLRWTAEPTTLPKRLYTCHTLVELKLSNEILVDVSFHARLPSLLYLNLYYVVYKDEDSLVTLLSSSPVLDTLRIKRRKNDNLRNVTVKVPSLQTLIYENCDNHSGSLVIDSPLLETLVLFGVYEGFFIEKMPCLDMAMISNVYTRDDKFLESLLSSMHLCLQFTMSMAAGCKFSQLVEFFFRPKHDSVDWLEQLMSFLQNSPKLTILTISKEAVGVPPVWNQPSIIPVCLSSHLEIFKWKNYGGRESEKQLLTYILANATCLQTVEISIMNTCNLEETQTEIESMPRISTSTRLIFTTNMELGFNGLNLDFDYSKMF